MTDASFPSSASRTLSEHESKQLLSQYGVPCAREEFVRDPVAARAAAEALGFPVVVKLCGDAIAHKTERNLVRLGLGDAGAVESQAAELLAAARPEDGEVGLLVAEQVAGRRELIAGLVRDPQFGPCVVLGLGGILTEALADAVFARAPLAREEAEAMVEGLSAHHLVTKPFRGEPAIDRGALAEVLLGLSRLAEERADVASVDLNPLIVVGDRPVAVDALVELAEGAPEPAVRPLPDEATLRERFAPLFSPRGIIVTGVSAHPGKFGFVTYHNLLRYGFEGELFPIQRDGEEILGRPTFKEIADVPEGAADLVFVCTPAKINEGLLRECAARGVRAAFMCSAGYGEAGEEGIARQRELVALCDELGLLMIGPNGQGVISTGKSMCAQIVAPYPPPGRISVVSQSGNLVSAFLNYAVQTGVGVSKAVSCGNSAQTDLAEVLAYFAADDETDAVVTYLEGVGDGRRLIEAMRRLTAKKPLVLVKGGVGDAGQRAAASHTGALASDDRVFDGIARQVGALRAPTVEEAFEWAATFSTQPLPPGRRTVTFTTVGGWGVLAADACSEAGLDVIALPDDLRESIGKLVPPRWSRNNPIDLAGGETRDTVEQVLDLVCGHPEVDAVLHLGIGIQAGQANVFRSGEFFPDHGLERISQFHEGQDRRYAQVAKEASERHGKPVLTTTELVHTSRGYENAGPAGVREAGRVCYPSAHRAVGALAALVARAEWLARNAR